MPCPDFFSCGYVHWCEYGLSEEHVGTVAVLRTAEALVLVLLVLALHAIRCASVWWWFALITGVSSAEISSGMHTFVYSSPPSVCHSRLRAHEFRTHECETCLTEFTRVK